MSNMNKMENAIIENKVIIENGEVKTILNEETRKKGYMTIDECGRLLHEMVNKTRELLDE
jgi:hypothetical protein